MNMNKNSNGSVTPHKNAHNAMEPKIPNVAFLFFDKTIIAVHAPGIPNIMAGKNPDMYIPRSQFTSAEVLPAQKLVKSPMPTVSNQ